jgi:hypothetical protein
MQQQSVHDAEDGCIRANPERQSENGNGGESRALGQGAKAETNVLNQSEHGIAHLSKTGSLTHGFSEPVSIENYVSVV